MKRLGVVVRTAQNLAVARSASATPPAIGTDVIDEELAAVGTVVDVFGPVDEPYVAVSPVADRASATLLGTKLYSRDG